MKDVILKLQLCRGEKQTHIKFFFFVSFLNLIFILFKYLFFIFFLLFYFISNIANHVGDCIIKKKKIKIYSLSNQEEDVIKLL